MRYHLNIVPDSGYELERDAMIRLPARYASVLFAPIALTLPAPAATPDIGTTLLVVRTVTGELATQVRRLVINDGVLQNEMIVRASDSASELEFVDATALTVIPRARHPRPFRLRSEANKRRVLPECWRRR